MSSREIVLKPVRNSEVAKEIDRALLKTKDKEEKLKKALVDVKNEGFIKRQSQLKL